MSKLVQKEILTRWYFTEANISPRTTEYFLQFSNNVCLWWSCFTTGKCIGKGIGFSNFIIQNEWRNWDSNDKATSEAIVFICPWRHYPKPLMPNFVIHFASKILCFHLVWSFVVIRWHWLLAGEVSLLAFLAAWIWYLWPSRQWAFRRGWLGSRSSWPSRPLELVFRTRP